MKYAFATLALASVALGQNSFTIDTPTNLVECEPTLLQWSGGTPPYFLSVLPGNQPAAAAIESLGQQTGTSYTWDTDIKSGTSIGLSIRDSTGLVANSAAVTITAGTTTCIGKKSSTSSGHASSAKSSSKASSTAKTTKTSSVASTTLTSTSATSALTTATSSLSGSSSATLVSPSSAAASATSTGAAKANAVSMGAAAIVGAAVMAVLA